MCQELSDTDIIRAHSNAFRELDTPPVIPPWSRMHAIDREQICVGGKPQREIFAVTLTCSPLCEGGIVGSRPLAEVPPKRLRQCWKGLHWRQA